MIQSESEREQLAVSITTQSSGFYQGFNRTVAVIPKILIGALIIWVGFSPSVAGQLLLDAQNWSTQNFGGWYVYVTASVSYTHLTLPTKA